MTAVDEIRQGRPSAERSAEIRLAILEAALDLLSRHGIGGTSLEMVAKEAQVTKRTVYRHFVCKKVLINAAVSREIARIDQSALPPPSTELDILETLKYYCHHLLPSLQNPRFIRFLLFLIFEGLSDPAVAEQTRLWLHRGQAPMLQLVTRATEQGVLKGDPLSLTLLLTDMMIAGPLERIRHGMPSDLVFGGLSQAAFVEERWSIFLSHAGAPTAEHP